MPSECPVCKKKSPFTLLLDKCNDCTWRENCSTAVLEIRDSGRRISKQEWVGMRLNSWEREMLLPQIDNEAMIWEVESCLKNCAVPRRYRPAITYEEIVIGRHVPELVRRLSIAQIPQRPEKWRAVVEAARAIVGKDAPMLFQLDELRKAIADMDVPKPGEPLEGHCVLIPGKVVKGKNQYGTIAVEVEYSPTNRGLIYIDSKGVTVL